MLLELIDAGAVMKYHIGVKDKNLLFPWAIEDFLRKFKQSVLKHHNAKPGCRQTKIDLVLSLNLYGQTLRRTG